MILSDDIGYDIRPFRQTDEADRIAKVYEKSIDRIFERCKLKSEFRTNLRDAIVDGDCVKYFWFDPEEENGQAVTGEIKAENLMNTNVLFGNPFSADVQSQPYLIIQRRRPVRQVMFEALPYENNRRAAYGEPVLSPQDIPRIENADDVETMLPFDERFLRLGFKYGVISRLLGDDNSKKAESVLEWNKFVDTLERDTPAHFEDVVAYGF